MLIRIISTESWKYLIALSTVDVVSLSAYKKEKSVYLLHLSITSWHLHLKHSLIYFSNRLNAT